MTDLSRSAPWWRRPTAWIVGAAVARYATGAWELRRTLALLNRPQPAPAAEPPNAAPAIHLVVPVLREQACIPAAVRWFAQLLRFFPAMTLTFVTTAREDRERDLLAEEIAGSGPGPVNSARFPQLGSEQVAALDAAKRQSPGPILTARQVRHVLEAFPTTMEVLDQELAGAAVQGLAIRRLHYNGDGRKAAQVNYAVGRLPDDSEAYVAVFDIDSRPELALWRRTVAFMLERRDLDGELPPVVQQSARFATRGISSRAWERAVCRGAARLQTLWTLRREIPSFHRYTASVRRSGGRPAHGLAQTVGHGLLVRLDVFRHVGGLPTFTLLDDLPFGYRLTVEKVPVHVVPQTAVADAPEHLSELVAQGRRWFHNYLDYPRCAAAARAAGHGSLTSRNLALAIGLYRGSTWLLRSPALALCLVTVAAKRTPWPTRVLAGAGVWLAVVTPVRALAAADVRPPSAKARGQECLELIAAHLVSSVGPVLALVRDLGRGARREGLSPKSERHTGARPPTPHDEKP